MQTVPHSVKAPEGGSALGHALISGLNVPLSALRAALESLALEVDGDERQSTTVAGALQEVSKVGRAVQDLADFAAPRPPMPLRCTVEEIVYSARHRLRREDRTRVLVARLEPGHVMEVDGPLLARCLARLIENAVEAGPGYVLVNVRSDGGDTLFTTVNRDPHGHLDLNWAQMPFQTDKPHHLGLGLALAKRDLELMGGALSLTRTPRGEAVAMARIPDSPPGGGSAPVLSNERS